MMEFLSSPFSFLLAFILYVVSDIIKFKRWAKLCRYLAYVILIGTVLFWIDQVDEKQHESRMFYHQELVTSVTLHVARLIEKGDYKTAGTILNRFNSDYWKYANNNEKIKNFIKSMDIPIYNSVAASLEKFENKKDDSEQSTAPDR